MIKISYDFKNYKNRDILNVNICNKYQQYIIIVGNQALYGYILYTMYEVGTQLTVNTK